VSAPTEIDGFFLAGSIGAIGSCHQDDGGTHHELLIGDAAQDPDEWVSLYPGYEGLMRLRELIDAMIADIEMVRAVEGEPE